MNTSPNKRVLVLVVGDSVGKSSLIRTITNQQRDVLEFDDAILHTVGLDLVMLK